MAIGTEVDENSTQKKYWHLKTSNAKLMISVHALGGYIADNGQSWLEMHLDGLVGMQAQKLSENVD